MKLYSYIITRDYGFAPNPFYQCCTLATCKPIIRKKADLGDIIVGLGSGAQNSIFKNKIIYVMIVDEKMTFDQYWNDERFQSKKPNMSGSKKQMYGDNIYHTDPKSNRIIQEDSHHSFENGETNWDNYNRDVPGKYVLASNHFWYWGGHPIIVPKEFVSITYVKRQHIVIDNQKFIDDFLSWVYSFEEYGYICKPHMFSRSFERYDGK